MASALFFSSRRCLQEPFVGPGLWWFIKLLLTSWFVITKPCVAVIPPNATFEAVIVGNGRSLLNSTLGSVIDKYQEVVRFNLFKTYGFEKNIGTKTTIWFIQAHDPKDRPPNGGGDVAREIVVPLVLRDGCVKFPWNCPPADSTQAKLRADTVAKYREMYRKVGLESKLVHLGPLVKEESMLYNELGFHARMPSTGLLAFIYMVTRYKQVALAGYDFAKGRHDHYFEIKRKRKTKHDMREETALINKFIERGQAYRLD